MGVLRMNDSEVLFYKFHEPKKAKKVIEILSLFPVAVIIYMFVKILILNKIFQNNDSALSISKIISFAITLAFVIFLYCKYTKTLKGVFVYNDYIQIVYAITQRHFFNIKPIIRYHEIETCLIIENNIHNRIKYNIPANFISGQGTEYVMLTTYNNQEFFFVVENQNDFIEQIELHMKK